MKLLKVFCFVILIITTALNCNRTDNHDASKKSQINYSIVVHTDSSTVRFVWNRNDSLGNDFLKKKLMKHTNHYPIFESNYETRGQFAIVIYDPNKKSELIYALK